MDYDNYRDFLRKQTDRFELVFLILGNHEFYSDSFAAGLQKARRLEPEPYLNRRLVLHRGRYDIPGSHVTILGCTLWSSPMKQRTLSCRKYKTSTKFKVELLTITMETMGRILPGCWVEWS